MKNQSKRPGRNKFLKFACSNMKKRETRNVTQLFSKCVTHVITCHCLIITVKFMIVRTEFFCSGRTLAGACRRRRRGGRILQWHIWWGLYTCTVPLSVDLQYNSIHIPPISLTNFLPPLGSKTRPKIPQSIGRSLFRWYQIRSFFKKVSQIPIRSYGKKVI